MRRAARVDQNQPEIVAALGNTDHHPGITVRHVHLQVAGEMMNVLTGPETPAQAAERVADHAEETRLDLMDDADAREREE